MNDDKKKLYQYQLSNLNNSTAPVIKDKQLSEGFKNPVVKGVTQHINTKEVVPVISGDAFKAKIDALRALKAGGKKSLSALPFAGAAYAALDGDPAMAAEELAGDVPVLGQAYEALKPTPTGNVDEEMQMLAERNAQEDYNNSPAHLARLEALKRIK